MSISQHVFKSELKNIEAYLGGKGRPTEISTRIHKLSSNENLFGTSPYAQEAIRQEIQSLQEYPPQTDEVLRQDLSLYYGHQLSPDQFISGNGGAAILAMIVEAFLDKETSCIVCNPCFLPYIQFAQKAGAQVIDIPLVGDHYDLDLDRILESIDDTTRIIWLCSPNNPTGTIIPRSQLETLLESIPDHVVVVYDEVYWQYAEADDYARGLPYVLRGDNVIAINSFSKAYGMAGLRVGYAYTTLEIAAYINNAKMPFMLNTLSMVAARAALKDTAFLGDTVVRTLRNKRDLCAALDLYGISYTPSEANFVLIDPEMPSHEFESRLASQGVMVRPADAFGAPGKVRVTIGTSANNEAFLIACKTVMGR